MMPRVIAIAAALAAAACFDPEAPVGLGCSESNACPDDQVCFGGACVVEVPQLDSVALGCRHTCGLYDDGSVRCWGANSFGQLGYGDLSPRGADPGTVPRLLPAVDLGDAAIALAAGCEHTCALLASERITCWGANDRGQLGLGSTEPVSETMTPSSLPLVDVGEAAIAVAAGGDTTCAVLAPRSMRCWGANDYGQAGVGDNAAWVTIGDDELPVEVPDVSLPATIAALAIGNEHVCAGLGEVGAYDVHCWGRGIQGRLGRGDQVDLSEPPDTPVALRATAFRLAAGGSHTCASTSADELRCWGLGADGRLGTASTENVGDNEAPADAPAVGLAGPAAQLALGRTFSCALVGEDVRCWGAGDALGLPDHGEPVGDDEPPSDAPAIALLDAGQTVAQLTAGGLHACAVIDEGDGRLLRCWGHGGDGRLGHGDDEPVGDDEDPRTRTVPIAP